jgi:hypothetical protein
MQKILGAIMENLDAMATWRPEFVHAASRYYFKELNY